MINEKQCGGQMRRFMEVCLLELLQKGDAHGYALADQLVAFGFKSDELHISTLYRTLRGMEHFGWVNSVWEQSAHGPKRRVYRITQQGKVALEQWISILKARRERITKLLNAHDKTNI